MKRHKPIRWLPGFEIQIPWRHGRRYCIRFNWVDSGGLR